MSVAGWRFAQVQRTPPIRTFAVGALEALPLICPLLVLIGSLTMLVIALCKDWPQ